MMVLMFVFQLSEVGDFGFIEAEGQASLQLNASGSVISLTGSNPLHQQAMNHFSNSGLVVFLNVQKSDILNRLEWMKVNRIVGQADGMSMDDLLDYRQQFYEGSYDLRVMCQEQEDPDKIANRVLKVVHDFDNHHGYTSTRGEDSGIDFNKAVLQGMAEDRGLYVPSGDLPNLSTSELQLLVNMNYHQRALRILEKLIHPVDMHPSNLFQLVQGAYCMENFRSKQVFPVVPLGQDSNQFLVEMFHGPTASFKDGALQLLSKFFQNALNTLSVRDRYTEQTVHSELHIHTSKVQVRHFRR